MSPDPKAPQSKGSRSNGPPCAYCHKRPRSPDYAPFCSKGCANRDLLHWLGESYTIPDNTPLDSDEDPV